jgi:NADH:ubiquinone oxidoreductase subunit E
LPDKLTYEEIVKKHIERKGRTTEVILPVLEEIQETYGYLPREAMEYLADVLKVSPAVIYSTATFYHFFSLEPKGEVIIRVCRGTACHVMGSGIIMNELIDELGLQGEGTTPDGKFTLESVGCIGCCSTGPNMVVIKDGKEEIFGYLTPQKAREVVKKIKEQIQSQGVGV